MTPWEGFRYEHGDEMEFTTFGYPCVIRINDQNTLCGYIGIEKGHPLWLGDCDDLDIQSLEVHGGVTYTGFLKGGTTWYIGFDCAHSSDHVPGPKWEIPPFVVRPSKPWRDHFFVKMNINELAAQLKIINSERKSELSETRIRKIFVYAMMTKESFQKQVIEYLNKPVFISKEDGSFDVEIDREFMHISCDVNRIIALSCSDESPIDFHEIKEFFIELAKATDGDIPVPNTDREIENLLLHYFIKQNEIINQTINGKIALIKEFVTTHGFSDYDSDWELEMEEVTKEYLNRLNMILNRFLKVDKIKAD